MKEAEITIEIKKVTFKAKILYFFARIASLISEKFEDIQENLDFKARQYVILSCGHHLSDTGRSRISGKEKICFACEQDHWEESED